MAAEVTAAHGDDARVLVRAEGLAKHYPQRGGLFRKGNPVRAVDGVTFDVLRRETLALVGESGCGKSTTGRVLLHLERPTSGSVTFDGVDLAGLKGQALRRQRRNMQMVFQNPHASLNQRMTVHETIVEPLEVHNLMPPRQRGDRVRELLSLVGLQPAMADHYPHEFSGGQRQRIGIARALASEPAFIVCDEAVSALDVSIQAQILNLLMDLRDRLALTYLFIAHDLGVVRYLADRVVVMYLGRVAEIAPVEELFDLPLHPYSEALLSAVPSIDPDAEARRERIRLTGELPSAADPPAGCRFHTRCPIAEPRCAVEDPPLRQIRGGHLVACHFAEQQLHKHKGRTTDE